MNCLRAASAASGERERALEAAIPGKVQKTEMSNAYLVERWNNDCKDD